MVSKHILGITIQECSKITKPDGNNVDSFVSGCFAFSTFLGRDYLQTRTKVHSDQPINKTELIFLRLVVFA